jgi:hypothetical protein
MNVNEEVDVAADKDTMIGVGLTGLSDAIGQQLQQYHSLADKRSLCRPKYVYNPVSGRCQASLLALRQGRSTAD